MLDNMKNPENRFGLRKMTYILSWLCLSMNTFYEVSDKEYPSQKLHKLRFCIDGNTLISVLLNHQTGLDIPNAWRVLFIPDIYVPFRSLRGTQQGFPPKVIEET